MFNWFSIERLTFDLIRSDIDKRSSPAHFIKIIEKKILYRRREQTQVFQLASGAMLAILTLGQQISHILFPTTIFRTILSN